MFDALHRYLTGADDAHRIGGPSDAAFALAVLGIDVARSNADRAENREHSVIERVLAARFDLERGEVTRLMTAAEVGAIQSTDLFHFTPVVVKKFSEQERIGVIEMLWEVAYSDGVLTGDEDTLIRQVAGLIEPRRTGTAAIGCHFPQAALRPAASLHRALGPTQAVEKSQLSPERILAIHTRVLPVAMTVAAQKSLPSRRTHFDPRQRERLHEPPAGQMPHISRNPIYPGEAEFVVCDSNSSGHYGLLYWLE